MLTLLFIAIMALVIAFLVSAIWEEVSETDKRIGRFTVVFVFSLATSLLLVELAGHGSTSFEDMQNDVMDALQWLDVNAERLQLNCRSGEDAPIAKSSKIEKSFFVF